MLFPISFSTASADDWQKIYISIFLNYKHKTAEWIAKQQNALKDACKISWYLYAELAKYQG